MMAEYNAESRFRLWNHTNAENIYPKLEKLRKNYIGYNLEFAQTRKM